MEEQVADTPARKALRAADQDMGELTISEHAVAMGVSRTALVRMRAALRRKPSVRARIESGELSSIAEVGYAAGLPSHLNSKTRRFGTGELGSYSRVGDNFMDSVALLERYLAKWKKKGYAFTHLSPKEARRRLDIIENLRAELDAMSRDLERRSHRARLSFDGRK